MFEFLLINHPLDCPVCDKGGECPLQDFSYSFGPNESRMEFPRRVFDGEGVKADVDFGPTLMLNRNRCILCTRCVRFMREVDSDAQISIVDRGYGSEIATFQEEGVHSLLSGNLMDVCPVGAITTRDYRFKARPWDNPEAVDTICTLCEKGCNTTAWIKAKPEWAKGARSIRMTPRFNPDVNGYWMCDIGRFDYHWVEGDERLQRPLVQSAAACRSRRLESGAFDRLRARGRRRWTAGDAFPDLRARLARRAGRPRSPGRRVRPARRRGDIELARASQAAAAEDEVRFPPVDAPNVNGARDLGFPVNVAADGRRICGLRSEVEAGACRCSMSSIPGRMDRSAIWPGWSRRGRAGKLPFLIVQGVLLTELAKVADVVLPGASWVEKDASYVNKDGRLQASSRAITPPGEAQDDWKILTDVGLALGAAVAYPSSAEIRAEMAQALSSNPRYADLAALSSSARCPHEPGSRRRIRPSGGSGISCSRICRR